LEKLAAIATEECYKAGHQICKEGDPAEFFHILEEGKILVLKEISIDHQGPPDNVTLDFVNKGEAIGWSAFIKPYVYNLGLRCVDDSKLIAFNAAKLRVLLNKGHISFLKIEQAIWKTRISRPREERICAFSLRDGCV
jgi:CRP-like cAMP-binding protein